MADGQLDYEVKIDVPTKGLDEGTSKLEMLEKQLKTLQQPGKIAKLEQEIAQFGKKSEGHFHGVGHAVDETKEKIHHMAEFLGLALAFELVKELTHEFIHLGGEILDVAAKAQRLELAFELSLGGKEGEATLEYLDQIAHKTEFTDDQLKGWAKQLINAGVAVEDLDKNMAAALDIAAKAPDKMEGMQAAVAALMRGELTGSVDMRQLRGLSIGVKDLQELPKFAGMTAKAIKKQMEEGKLTKEDLFEVVAGADKELGDLGLKAGNTLQAKWAHVKDLPEQFFQRLAKTDAVDKLSGALERALEAFDPDSPQGRRMSEFLEKAVGGFADLIDSMDFEAAVESLIEVFEGLGDVVGPVLRGLNAELQGFAYLTAVARGEGDQFVEKFAKAEQAHKARQLARQVRDTQKEAEKNGDFDDLDAAAASGALGERSKFWNQQGEAAADGFAKGAQKGKHKARAAAADVGGEAEEGIREELDTHSPSRVFEDIGADVAAGFSSGVSGAAGDVDRALTDMVAGGRGAGGGLGGGFTLQLSIGPNSVTVPPGADAGQAGDDAGAAFSARVRDEFTQIVEQILQEQGLI